MNACSNLSIRRHRSPINAVLFSQPVGLPRRGPPLKRVGQDFSKMSIYAREAALIIDEEGQKVFEAVIAKHGYHPRLLKLQKEIFGRYLVSPPQPFSAKV